MPTLGEIEKHTKEYADARDNLSDTVRALEDKIEALKRQYLPGIKKQVGIATAKKLDLKNAIEDRAGLSKSPGRSSYMVSKWVFRKVKERSSLTSPKRNGS